VTVLWGGDYPSHEPGAGTAAAFPWKAALDAISTTVDRQR
jgi:hypothetical protein